MRKLSILLICLLLSSLVTALSPPTPAVAANGADFNPGRIIDDAVFKNKSSMNVDQIHAFLHSKVTCDRWGTKAYGSGTRAQYGTSRGNPPPYTCLPDYVENPSTGENNLEGRPTPVGGLSAAQIIWLAAQEYNVNPQVLIVLIQREQGLVTDEWPFKVQYDSATGYACPDVGPNHSIVCQGYFGFAQQVYAAAWQFQRYAQRPNEYNFVSNTNNTIQWSPQPSCGTSVVYIENQSTASLYNYAPYRPNAAALANLYGTGDACSSYANRNFWRYFTDWFGNTLINDPFGWDVIKIESDGRWWLVVGRTKRYIPTSALYYDWDLDKKPVRTVSQAEFDGYQTLPDLERLGWFGDRYYFIDGGKKYWLSTDPLLKAWGQYYKRPHAAAAFTLIANMPDGGEATFYAAQASEGKIAFLDDGKRYSFATTDADRWRANPIQLTSDAYNAMPQMTALTQYVSINGLKFVVDNGRLLDVTNPIVQRAFNIDAETFTSIPGSVTVFMRSELAMPTVVEQGSPHWYRVMDGKKYHVLTSSIANTWLGGQPTTISSKLFNSFTNSTTPLLAIIHEPVSDDYYLIDDGVKRKLTGTMRESLLGGGITYTEVDAASVADIANGPDISTPLLRNRSQGHVYTLINGYTYHIPTMEVQNAFGVPRRYTPADVSANATNSLSPNFVPTNMFLSNGGTTYFMQDGHAFPIAAGAVNDWLGSVSATSYLSSNFSTRFNVQGTSITQRFKELGRNMIASGGRLVDVGDYNDAYDNGTQWSSLIAFGAPRDSQRGTYIVRSSDSSDGRLWLINQGKKFYIANLDQLFAYNQGGRVATTTLSPAVINLFSTGTGNPSLLTISQGSGFKLLETDGSFYSFPDGDTAVNFVGSNRIEVVAQTIANGFSREKSPITRLIRDPGGKVYWVENGQKRWILSLSTLRQYEGTRLTEVSHSIANWLPDGPVLP